MRRLLVIACLLASACTTALPTPSPTASPQSQPTARVSLRSVGLGNGLTIDVPVGWEITGLSYVNRVTQRLLLVGNRDLASLPTIPGNGDLDAAALPSGSVTVEVETFCGMSCQGPPDESALPLDWSQAVPRMTGLPAGRHELMLGVRWFDRPFLIVARWADDASASDIAAIADITRSVRADPAPPATGEYNGWAGLGQLASIPVGSVQFEALPPGAIIRPPYRVWDNEPYFLVRGKQNVYAFVSRPLHDQRCEVHYEIASDLFSCTIDGRTYQWTRFGHYLGPEPASDLSQHQVMVRGGSVWVRYIEDSLLVPSVRDEAAER
jgi:hypothetical protein